MGRVKNPATGKLWTQADLDAVKTADQPDPPPPTRRSLYQHLVKQGLDPVRLSEMTTAELAYYFGMESPVDHRLWAECHKRLTPGQKIELELFKDRNCVD